MKCTDFQLNVKWHARSMVTRFALEASRKWHHCRAM